MEPSQKKQFKETLTLPEKVTCTIQGTTVTLKGTKGELSRRFPNPNISIATAANGISLTTKSTAKKDKKTIGSIKSHIKNMIKGVSEGYVYEMKICSGHFPMNVAVAGKEFVVKNFLGERVPRKIQIKGNVTIKINGSDIKLEGVQKEEVSQTAASIEQLTRRSNFDRRIFQDGIYIITKDGKSVR